MADTPSVEKAMQAASAAINKTKPVRRRPVATAVPKKRPTPSKTTEQPATVEQIYSAEDAELIKKFKAFVDASKLALEKDGKLYLKAEAWQYIMTLKNLRANNVCTVERRQGGEMLVFCQSTIYTVVECANQVDTAGSMMASSKEKFLKDKPEYAVYGMAQTRAVSRALRNKYGWLARACGYEAVPLEEIK